MKKLKETLIKLNNYKFFILLVLVLVGAFYWCSVRPNIEKRGCYSKAREEAIAKTVQENSEPYLYDRNNWRNYTTCSVTVNNPDSIFDTCIGKEPTFANNLSTGVEPAYIQENLDQIAKGTDFNLDDYNTDYKLCLQSEGLW